MIFVFWSARNFRKKATAPPQILVIVYKVARGGKKLLRIRLRIEGSTTNKPLMPATVNDGRKGGLRPTISFSRRRPASSFSERRHRPPSPCTPPTALVCACVPVWLYASCAFLQNSTGRNDGNTGRELYPGIRRRQYHLSMAW